MTHTPVGEAQYQRRYHETRFRKLRRRDRTWQALWSFYFSKFISREDAVLDLGAGYGNFINLVQCRQRYAVDLWPGFEACLVPGVIAQVGSLADLGFVPDASIDCALASNVLEHLQRPELLAALQEIRRKLKPQGLLFVLQPNFRYAYRRYFDDFTHIGVFSDRSLRDLLSAYGFRVLECIPRFLPFSVEGLLPVWSPLIWLYLKSPLKPFGAQMLLRATPDERWLPDSHVL